MDDPSATTEHREHAHTLLKPTQIHVTQHRSRAYSQSEDDMNALRQWLYRWVLSSTTTIVWFQQLCGLSLVEMPSVKTSTGSLPNGSSESSPNNSKDDAAGLHIHTIRVNNSFLYHFFKCAAALGNEQFYILCLPLPIWWYDMEFGRQLVELWALVYYLGQTFKDHLQLPRPQCPPVAVLERHYETEYGMPSTHAEIGTAIPMFVVIKLWQQGILQLSDYTLPLAICLGIVWCSSISLSRLYVGVHSIADVVCGILLGGAVAVLHCLYGAGIDEMLQGKDPSKNLTIISTILFLVAIYPRPAKWTNSAGDTTLILGVMTGVVLASSNYLPAAQIPPVNYHAALSRIGLQLVARFVCGGALLLSTRMVVKRLYSIVATQFWKTLGWSTVNLTQQYSYELPGKLLTYGAVGCASYMPMASLCRLLHI